MPTDQVLELNLEIALSLATRSQLLPVNSPPSVRRSGDKSAHEQDQWGLPYVLQTAMWIPDTFASESAPCPTRNLMISFQEGSN